MRHGHIAFTYRRISLLVPSRAFIVSLWHLYFRPVNQYQRHIIEAEVSNSIVISPDFLGPS